MARLVVNAVADRDIGEVLDFVGQTGGATAAARYDRSFDAFFVRLMKFPESGSLRSNLRVGVIHPYLVIYRYNASRDLIEILRILHGRRDLKPTLLPP